MNAMKRWKHKILRFKIELIYLEVGICYYRQKKQRLSQVGKWAGDQLNNFDKMRY